MLHRFGVVFGVLGIAILLMAGCSGEKGAKGDPGTAECIQCHSDNTTIVAIDGQWRNSVHFTGGNFERNTPPCSGCHTSEGFVAKLNTGDPGTPLNPSPVGCFACHEPHTNHNFNLRTTAPVALEMFNATYDKGLSNLCANCHHARALSPAIADTVRITSSRWGPHHGPQADILNGTGAFQFAGAATYRNSPHRNLVTDGCPQCHMATPFGTQSGGHTMNMAYTFHGSAVDNVAGCNNDACHSGLTDFDYNGTQDSVETYLMALRSVLGTAGYLDTTTNLVRASSSNPLILNRDQAGALYNFLLVEPDRSLGVHNTKYVLDALKASIAALAAK